MLEEIDKLVLIGQRITVVAVLLVLIWGGLRRWWVFGWVYRDQVERDKVAYAEKAREAEEWKQLALRGTDLLERNVDPRGRRER
jgi:hypothetical protein